MATGRAETRFCALQGEYHHRRAVQGANEPGEGKALDDQCEKDDGEGKENDQVAAGEGLPAAVSRGSASAAARESTPRIPVKATRKICCQGGDGIALAEGRDEPAGQIACGEDPDDADDHDHEAEDQGVADAVGVESAESWSRMYRGSAGR